MEFRCIENAEYAAPSSDKVEGNQIAIAAIASCYPQRSFFRVFPRRTSGRLNPLPFAQTETISASRSWSVTVECWNHCFRAICWIGDHPFHSRYSVTLVCSSLRPAIRQSHQVLADQLMDTGLAA
jgi:hypothetical protein